jgi:hypothetical protein
VDIPYARANGIEVTGIRDYGDKRRRGYVLYEAIGLLHGYGPLRWDDYPHELTDKKAGMVGMGTTGSMIADALQLLGAEISYFAPERKAGQGSKRHAFSSLHDLLRGQRHHLPRTQQEHDPARRSGVCRHDGQKNAVQHIDRAGSTTRKRSKKWLAADPEHYFFCDSLEAAGDPDILNYPNAVRKGPPGSGASTKANERLTDKVLAILRNI